MKKLITLLLVLVTLNSYSQPIDYNNFDNEIATLRLKEAFLNFLTWNLSNSLLLHFLQYQGSSTTGYFRQIYFDDFLSTFLDIPN